MAEDQDWCLQCGAGAPGGVGTPSWRSAAVILGTTAVLALGAAAAGYAALTKPAGKPATTTVAQTTVPAATPTVTTPTPTIPGATSTPPASVPTTAVTPPKIPIKATTTPTTSTPKTTTTPSNTGGAGAKTEPKTAAILLDTDAASTYNPYKYAETLFGDPSLTIDGDTSTAWTAQVEPSVAPKLAEGLLISLKSKQSIAQLKLVTATPGMTVQVYGANGKTAPDSITDPGWTTLSDPRVVKKRHAQLKLRYPKKSFSFIALWISKAPEGSTSEDPGHVSVNELELFPSS